MENDSFLKKFQGRTEVIGRGGLMDIMNNVHINVNDYQIKPKKLKSPVKKKKSLKDEYNYVRSEISEEFNKNKNFVPQMRSLSISVKSHENNKNNELNDNNNKRNNSIKLNNDIKQKNRNNKSLEASKTEKNKNNENKNNNIYKSEKKNRLIGHNKKQKEKPIKLFKYSEENNIKQQKENIKKPEEMKNNFKNRQSPNKNKKNEIQIIEPKKKINKNKLNIQLPSIILDSSLPKNNSKNNLRVKPNKSYDRANTFTPKLKNSIKQPNNLNKESEKNYQSLKEILGKIKNKKKDKNENFQNNSLSLPKIGNKMKINSPNKNIKEFSSRKNVNIQNNYNNILNNIKNDFLLLDSIKNRNNNYTERNYQNNNLNYQINNTNDFNDINDQNINDYKKKRSYKSPYKINNYIDNDSNKEFLYNNISNDYNIMNNNNIYSINQLNNVNSNIVYSNNKNVNNNRYNSNDNDLKKNNAYMEIRQKKKSYTSFDNPPIPQGLKNKLDIIHEEDEDDNKYITDFHINNNFENQRNLNSLEILMRQRKFYQNKIPNNSRFKIKQIAE